MPGFEVLPRQMIVTRAGTPQPVVDQLNADVKSIMTAADVPPRIVKMGMMPADTGTPQQLKRFVETEIERWAKIVRIAGIAGYV